MKSHLKIRFTYRLLTLTVFTFFIKGLSAQVIELQRISSNSNELCFVHKIRKSETLFSLARVYDQSVREIEEMNPNLNLQSLHEGQEIRIPVKPNGIASDSVSGSRPVFYKVMPKDNLFSISHRLLKIKEKELHQLNHHLTSELKNGDVLLVGYFKTKSSVESVLTRETPLRESEIATNETHLEFIPNVAYSRGIALVETKGLGEGRYFALHATAPIESSIAITNPVNQRVIYAKVIGRIPPIYEPGVQIVVSSSVARFLGVPDHRFYAAIAYQKTR